MGRKILLKESFIATMIIIMITWVISLVPLSREYFKAFHQGLADFDLYDLDYSRLYNNMYDKNEKNKSFIGGTIYEKDSNIVLIELGDNRSDIANQINLVSKYDPKVIALDMTFESSQSGMFDSLGNGKMDSALKGKSKIIFGYRVSKGIDINSNHFQPDSTAANIGFFNFDGEENSVIRSYAPSVKIGNVTYQSFTTAIMRKFDSTYDASSDLGNYQRQINYSGNTNHYLAIDKFALDDYEKSGQLAGILKGKIVLIGFFVLQDENEMPPLLIDDLHFTPLNKIVSGKSFPDMYGVVIHANILSMIINGKYTLLASLFISYLLAFLFTFGMIYFLIYQHNRNKHYWHIFYIFIQVLAIIIVLYFFLFLFSKFHIKIRLQPVMVSMVLSLEAFGIYKLLASWLNKKFHYKTIFKHKTGI